jgi:hypothetical protein
MRLQFFMNLPNPPSTAKLLSNFQPGINSRLFPFSFFLKGDADYSLQDLLRIQAVNLNLQVLLFVLL